MPDRIRNTKQLAKRIDRGYLSKLYPIPLWRRILTGCCLAIALGWLGMYAIARNQTPYTAGALTPAHSLVGNRCAVCHGASTGIAKRIADKQCAACHDAPPHNVQQITSPACVDCHVEHRGRERLTMVGDRNCVACHGNLKTKSGKLTVAASMDSFQNHPEFAALRDAKDPGTIKFNHQKHVGELSQKCGDCHQPTSVTPANMRTHVSSRALMQIPTYAGTCLPCHALTIDDKISDPAPHDKPAVVHQFVSDRLTSYIAAHPSDLGKDGAPGTPAAWVQFKIAADEKQLWETTCARCHTIKLADSSELPAVAAAAVPQRWFRNASFDHSAHQELACASCHPAATTSTVSSDVMMPGVQVCQRCHNSDRLSGGATCSTCHVYHEWTKEKGVEGKYKIDQIAGLLYR